MKHIQFSNKDPVKMLLKNDIIILLKFMSGENISSISETHKISTTDVNFALKRTLRYFSTLKRKIIRFPKTNDDLKKNIQVFKGICNSDNIIGIICITSFPVTSNDTEELSLQMCIDYNNCITAIDTQLTKTESEIYDMIYRPYERMNITIRKPYKLYAASELYSHLENVVQATPDHQYLSDSTDKFFDELRSKFMKLNCLNTSDGISNNDIVVVACVLFNIMSLKK